MNPRGGTEILWEKFTKYVNKNLRDRVNIILSECSVDLLKSDMPNILWQHVDTDQRVAFGLNNKEFVSKLNKIVFVSNWQKQKYIKEFDLPPEKCIVLLNAVEPFEWTEKSLNEKLKLIYTSTPWRGLEILVESFRLLNRDDIELDVYSSTVIYGAKFMPNAYEWLFNKCRQTSGINYKGYVANKAIIKAVQQSHIFAYPSIFPETSCLAAIEAGTAGCKIVTTDLGALSETCGNWAEYTSATSDDLIERYANLLLKTINEYNTDHCYEQHLYFKDKFSWLSRKFEWEKLLLEVLND